MNTTPYSMPTPDYTHRLSPLERKSALSLGSIFALRMLGLFLILPVLSLWATGLEGGQDRFLVGLALGIYGLTQGVLQIPFGAASDRFGRKPVIIVGLIIFIAGSIIAATADTITGVIIGRSVQGAGAISAAVTAMISDSVRERVLTRAMAFVGASIGSTFALSLILSPVLANAFGVPFLFWLTAALSVLAIAAVIFIVPDAPARHAASMPPKVPTLSVVFDTQLLRLNLGIFVLHMAQMALFVVIPVRLASLGLEMAHHWYVYLPAVLVSFVFLIPALKHAERTGRTKQLFVFCICLLLTTFAGFEIFDHSVLLIALLLLVFFSGFNVLEASLPSLVSKTAPAASKGLALGVYNTTQSVGLFVGGALGGWLFQRFGTHGVYAFCAVLLVIWILSTAGLKMPQPHETGREIDLA